MEFTAMTGGFPGIERSEFVTRSPAIEYDPDAVTKKINHCIRTFHPRIRGEKRRANCCPANAAPDCESNANNVKSIGRKPPAMLGQRSRKCPTKNEIGWISTSIKYFCHRPKITSNISFIEILNAVT